VTKPGKVLKVSGSCFLNQLRGRAAVADDTPLFPTSFLSCVRDVEVVEYRAGSRAAVDPDLTMRERGQSRGAWLRAQAWVD